jgi:hypothetical protein
MQRFPTREFVWAAGRVPLRARKLRPLRAFVCLASILGAFSCSRQSHDEYMAEHGCWTKDSIKGGRYQIGDLVFQIPPSQVITHMSGPGAMLGRDYSDHGPDKLDPTAEQLDGLTVWGEEVDGLAGVISGAKSDGEATRSDRVYVQVSIYRRPPQESPRFEAMRPDKKPDMYCRPLPPGAVFHALMQRGGVYFGQYLLPERALEKTENFYVYGDPEIWAENMRNAQLYDKVLHKARIYVAAEGQRFFNAPILLDEFPIDEFVHDAFAFASDKRGVHEKKLSYVATAEAELSSETGIRITFRGGNFDEAGILAALGRVELGVTSWVALTKFTPKLSENDPVLQLCEMMIDEYYKQYNKEGNAR